MPSVPSIGTPRSTPVGDGAHDPRRLADLLGGDVEMGHRADGAGAEGV
jgi:hypothetical protein